MDTFVASSIIFAICSLILVQSEQCFASQEESSAIGFGRSVGKEVGAELEGEQRSFGRIPLAM